MSTLWIREYAGMPAPSGSFAQATPPIAKEPGAADQAVTFSTATQSSTFGATTTIIGMIADAAFHYVVGSNPTATTNNFKVPADTLHWVTVIPGQKISAIAAA